MFIQTENTPNPNTLKFIPGDTVLQDDIGGVDYRKGSDVSSSPLAKRLFQVDGVDGVFLGGDFLSITKDDTLDWHLLKPSVLGIIIEHFISGAPIYGAGADTLEEERADDPLSARIRELIDARVRPSVAMDGGDIRFEVFADGIVYVSMYGSCSGCPSSKITLKNGIEHMLKQYLPEVLEVRQYAK